MKRIVAVSLLVLLSLCSMAAADPFATVMNYDPGTNPPTGYDLNFNTLNCTDPSVVQGAPATTVATYNWLTFAVNPQAISMVNPAWVTMANTSQVLTIGTGGYLQVSFGQQVMNNNQAVNSAANNYGLAFQIFTNAGFNANGNTITDGSFFGGGQIGTIKVSQDGTTWYKVDPAHLGPVFPTQAYLSDDPNAATDGVPLSSFTTPVDPTLQAANFAGLTEEQAIGLYHGSAGGLGINLNYLIDPATGLETSLSSIEFVEVDGQTDGITGFADTSVPEPATLGLAAIALAGLAAKRKKG